MSPDAGLSRRGFLGGALCLGAWLGCGGGAGRMIRRADQTGELSPNMYITVLPSGRVALAIGKCEMGQGVTTGYATLVAEELEVAVDEVDFHFADSLPEHRITGAEGVPMFRIHATGGSTSTQEAYIPLREAAAAAREMLVAAAARAWGVRAADCAAEAGRVVHRASRRSEGYGALTARAAREEVPDRPRLKQPGQFRQIGVHSRRVDARAKVVGAARFGIDVAVPGMVRALVIHGPVYGARPAAVRADAARAVAGVIDVFPFRWGVAVVAEKYWQALRAARDIEVDWGEGIIEGLDTSALQRAARAYREPGIEVRSEGDIDAAMRGPEVTALEAVYEAPYLAHAPMEPQNCTVSVGEDSAEVWAPCQVPTVIQEAVGEALGIAADDVLVHTTYAGGGFGRRLLGDFAAQAALIAKVVRRPVQMIWSRESDTRQGFYRPAATAFLRGAVGGDGRAAALSCHSLSQPITPHQLESIRGGQPAWLPRLSRVTMARTTAALIGTNTVADLFATEGANDTPYRIGNLRVEYTPIQSRMPVGFWRSVGHSFNAFFMEGFVDEMARAAGRDPYRFRRQMLADGSREQRVLDAVAALSDWPAPAAPGFARGIARHTSFGTEVAQVVEAGVVGGRIRVTRVWCAVDCGQVINPDIAVAQMESAIVYGISAALDQEITLVDGVVQQGNFDTYPALRMHECPEITVRVLDRREPPTGVGEPGLPPVAPAIASALFAATRVRLRRMPLQRSWNERRAGRAP
ncbi:MAG TPA: molybdopterin cofactor-binding domain-containing protein [Kofleriaceae bacterium]|nr:molybdopterin cofactor-binding domain-containing protein [Kofleriaceae bacterium]